MHKVVRNTLFTVAALGLTSLAIGWNKEISAKRQPLAVEQVALASQSQNDRSLPISVKAQDQMVMLGKKENIVIQTVAGATLNIVTKRPDNSIDPSHTIQATTDRTGRYVLALVISDYHYLGMFNISVTASSGGTTNQASDQFIVIVPSDQEPQDSQSGYPLIP